MVVGVGVGKRGVAVVVGVGVVVVVDPGVVVEFAVVVVGVVSFCAGGVGAGDRHGVTTKNLAVE